MPWELQGLVDSLGRRLNRSVAIDDRNLKLLAYTAHRTEVDDMRIHSIMQRAVPKDVVRYVHDASPTETDEMFVVPARPDLGLSIERIGFPIRQEGALLGFLWLLGSDGPVTEEQAAAAQACARSAGQTLQRGHLLGELSRGRKRELMRDLLSSESTLRREAAEKLIEEELVVAGPVTVIVATVVHADGRPLDEEERLAIVGSLERARQPLPPRSSIQLVRPDHGILAVVRLGASTDADVIAAGLHHDLRTELSRSSGECSVGIGEEYPSLVDLHHSYAEAKRSAEVGSIVKVLGGAVRHASLGVYGLLAELPPDRLVGSLHAGLRRLLDTEAEDDGDSLVRTLEVFLDTAGNVRDTATRMCVHRATVYYRLKRIEQVAGVDLANGNDRLALHIGLKVAQLIGLR